MAHRERRSPPPNARGGPPQDVREAPTRSEVGGPPGLLAESGFFVGVIQNGQVVRAAGDVPDQGSDLRAGLRDRGVRWSLVADVHDRAPSAPRQRELRSQGTVRSRPRPARGPDRGDAHTRRADLRSGHRAGRRASLLSGLALAPLSRLRRTVARVTSTRDLSRRLPGRSRRGGERACAQRQRDAHPGSSSPRQRRRARWRRLAALRLTSGTS